jgi:signal peptidase I
MEDKNELLEEEIENEFISFDQQDFTVETMVVRKTLRRRTLVVVLVVFAFFILRSFDPNIDFNNVNSTLFVYICSAIVIFATFIYFFDKSVDTFTYRNETVYRKYKRFNEILDIASVVPYLSLLVTISNMFLVSLSPITGTSMMPNYSDNEAVIFSHMGDSFERFDVVIVKHDSATSPYLIKRIMGLPGETVTVELNEVYINDVLLVQDFIDQSLVKTYCTNVNIEDFGEYTDSEHCTFNVPDDSYFVMGDNRDGNAATSSSFSLDSRYFGPVAFNNIYGKVVFQFKDYNLIK